MNSQPRPSVVAVTGASGYIGSRLLQELEEEENLAKVVAIDTKPLEVPFHNVFLERMDVTQPLDDTFRGHNVNVVVHLAFTIKPGRTQNEVEKIRRSNLDGVRSVLKACCAAKVRNFIYLSSHTIYGAHRSNTVPMTEEVSPRPSPDFQYAYDKALCEGSVQDFAGEHPEVNVTVLRSCVVMGPGADNFVTRAFFKPVLLGVMGYNPPMQFLHEDDLAKLLHMLIIEPHPGTYNVAGEGVVHYKRMAQLSRRKLVSLPSAMAYPLTQMAWKLGIQKDSPAAGLDFIRYPILISTSKLKEATGFSCFYTSEEALMDYLPDDSLP
ncbi:MAG: NAD-dependent epimerase/dehydratase family protein [Dehalococcoidia bacterium]|nr:NAD-dependent epimerase/dehydratase family protein [Dehalococcoidia bacterium]